MPKSGPNPIDLYVGSRIRIRRVMLQLSQEKLANRLGLTFQQVQKYEKGTNRVGASRLQQIAGVLNVSVSYFFADGDTVRGSQPSVADDVEIITAFLASEQGMDLNTAFAKLENPKIRQRVVKLIATIARAGEARK